MILTVVVEILTPYGNQITVARALRAYLPLRYRVSHKSIVKTLLIIFLLAKTE